MWFNQIVKSVVLFFASRLWPKNKKESLVPPAPESISIRDKEMMERLESLEAQVHHLAYKIETMATLHADMLRHISYQTSVAEELSAVLDSLPAPQTVQASSEPKVKVVAEFQQKSKKQILN